jgi:hypothetical protein
VITPRTTTSVNTRQQGRYPLPRRIRQLTPTHHKINYQTGPSSASFIDPGAWEGPTREEDRREEPKTAEEDHEAEEERKEKPSS